MKRMWRDRWQAFGWWHEIVLAALLLGLLAVATALMPNFAQVKSQLLLTRQLWEFAILSLGMTLVIITGGIDLSIGSAMGLCAVVFGIVWSATGSALGASLACLATGIGCGAFNGLLIARGKVHPLIV